MRSSILLSLLAMAFGPNSTAVAAPIKNAGDLYFLGMNVGTHDPKGTPDDWNFATEDLEKYVKAQCTPMFRNVKTNLVMGTKATPQGIMKGLEWLQENVKEGDLAVMYSGSHGSSDAKRGFCLHANGGYVYGDDIKASLAKVKGHVVVLIQACHSGDLVEKHRNDLEAMPKNCAVACACKAGQSSHGKMLPPIMEGLHGFADTNGDGIVSVGEYLHYIEYRISTYYPEQFADVQKAVVTAPKDFDLTTPLAKSLPPDRLGHEVVMVVQKNDWYGGIIVSEKDPTNKNRVLIHYFDSLKDEDEWVERERILPPDTGMAIVKSGEKWYTAAVLSKAGNNFRIRYLGSFDNKVEKVTSDRIEALAHFEPRMVREKKKKKE